MSWVGPGRAWPRSRACLKIGRAGMFDVGTGVLIDDSTRVGRMSKGEGGFPRAGADFLARGRISKTEMHFLALNLPQQSQPLDRGQSLRVMITGT